MSRPHMLPPRLPSVLLGAVAVTGVACGPGSEQMVVDVAHHEDGGGRGSHRASVAFVVAEGLTWWEASHAAGVSVSLVPEDPLALGACVEVEGGPRGESPSSGSVELLSLDRPDVRIEGREELEPQRIGPANPAFGQGDAYRDDFDLDELPFEPGEAYRVQALAGGGPGFAARITAPQPLELTRVGHSSPGTGTVTINRANGLTVQWTGDEQDERLFVIVEDETDAVVCRVADEGSFSIPSRHLETLSSGDGRLVVERVAELPFTTQPSPQDNDERSGRLRYSVQREQRLELR